MITPKNSIRIILPGHPPILPDHLLWFAESGKTSNSGVCSQSFRGYIRKVSCLRATASDETLGNCFLVPNYEIPCCYICHTFYQFFLPKLDVGMNASNRELAYFCFIIDFDILCHASFVNFPNLCNISLNTEGDNLYSVLGYCAARRTIFEVESEIYETKEVQNPITSLILSFSEKFERIWKFPSGLYAFNRHRLAKIACKFPIQFNL